MDFGPILGVKNVERKGRKREKWAQNKSGGVAGEVHSFPQKPATTRGNTREQTKKIPNSDELGIGYWWSWGDLNPRP